MVKKTDVIRGALAAHRVPARAWRGAAFSVAPALVPVLALALALVAAAFVLPVSAASCSRAWAEQPRDAGIEDASGAYDAKAELSGSTVSVRTAEELYDMAAQSADDPESLAGLTVEITADLDLTDVIAQSTSKSWPGISVTGDLTFNGNGHTVSGLSFTSGANAYAALFSKVTASEFVVSDLVVKGTNESINTAKTGCAAGLVGSLTDCSGVRGAVFKNVGCEVDVIGTVAYAAGFVGKSTTSKVSFEGCYNAGDISGKTYLGGFVAVIESGIYDEYAVSFENCYNGGALSTVTGSAAGGFIGWCKTDMPLAFSSCYNAGSVVAAGVNGAFIGTDDALSACSCANLHYLDECELTDGSSKIDASVADAEAMCSSTFVTAMNSAASEAAVFKEGNCFPLLAWQPDADAPVITLQPVFEPAYAQVGEQASTASVRAKRPSGDKAMSMGTIVYQWYESEDEIADPAADTPIAGATESSFTPATETAGVRYYYCALRNSYQGGVSATVLTQPARFCTVGSTPAAAPVITTQPVGADYRHDSFATALTVAAEATGEGAGTLSYQWYRATDEDLLSAEEIPNATRASYTPSTSGSYCGKTYYFCRVTNTFEWVKTAYTDTCAACVSVAGDVQIWSVEDLEDFRDSVNRGEAYNYTGSIVELMCDLDMSGTYGPDGKSWEPIGVANHRFSGTFNGAYHTISGFYMDTEDQYAGLFGFVSMDANEKGTDVCIENLTVRGTAHAGANAAGIVGRAYTDRTGSCIVYLRNLCNEVDVTCTNARCGSLGGIVGSTAGYVYIQTSANRGTIVSAGTGVGGIAGGMSIEGLLENCYNAGDVVCTGNAARRGFGGLVGTDAPTILSCYTSGAVLHKATSPATYDVGLAIGSSADDALGYSTVYFKTHDYEQGCQTTDSYAVEVSDADMRSSSFVDTLNGATGGSFKEGPVYPLLSWEASSWDALVVNAQPEDACVSVGATASALVFDVEKPEGTKGPALGVLTYQWYASSDAQGADAVAIAGAVSASYVPPSSERGTSYLYCVATDTYVGGIVTATSRIARVSVVDADPTPVAVITKQPENVQVRQNGDAPALEVGATGTGVVSYQWYQTEDGTPHPESDRVLSCASLPSYTPESTAEIGTSYYYCVVVNTEQEVKESEPVVSAVAKYEVTALVISTAEEFAAFRDEVNGANGEPNNFARCTVRLGANIDLSSVCGPEAGSWTPVGASSATPFCGEFDGQGYRVENLYINTGKTYQALFGYVKSGTNAEGRSSIPYLHDFFVTGKVVSTTNYTAGVVAFFEGTAKDDEYHAVLRNVGFGASANYADGDASVVGNAGTGGLASVVHYADILNCCCTADVRATYSGAGLVGARQLYIRFDGNYVSGDVYTLNGTKRSYNVNTLGALVETDDSGSYLYNYFANNYTYSGADPAGRGLTTGTNFNGGGNYGYITSTQTFVGGGGACETIFKDAKAAGLDVTSSDFVGRMNDGAGAYGGSTTPFVKNKSGTPLLYWQNAVPFSTEGYSVASIPDTGYTGRQVKPQVTVTNGKKTLTEGVDYTVRYLNNTDVGTASVEVTGTGQYKGLLTAEFQIVSVDFSAAQIEGMQAAYDKERGAVNPVPTSVVLNGSDVPSTCYSVSYLDADGKAVSPEAPGSYTAVIAGTGGFIGQKTFEFVIRDTVILSDLDDAIEQAQAASRAAVVSETGDGSDAYTYEYWVTQEDAAAFQTAISDAKGVRASYATGTTADQAAVDKAQTALTTAHAAFIKASKAGTKQVSKDALNAAISAAREDLAGTRVAADAAEVETGVKWVAQETADELDARIEDAAEVAGDAAATQLEVDGAAADLGTAKDAFDAAKRDGAKRPDFSACESALASARALADDTFSSSDGTDVYADEQWTAPERRDALDARIAAAEGVMADLSSTQEQTDECTRALKEETSAFGAARTAGSKQASRSDTESVLRAARIDRVDTAVSADGTDVQPGVLWVTSDAAEAFDEVILSATGTVGDRDASMRRLDGARTDILTAQDAFDAAKREGCATSDTTALQAAIAAAQADLAATEVASSGAAIAKGTYWVTQAEADTFKSAISDARATADSTGAIQAQIDHAVEVLQAAQVRFDAAKKPGEKVFADRLAGADRIATMQAIVDEAFPAGETCESVILASAENYPDALAASSLAGLLDCPVVTTRSDSLATEARNTIERLEPSVVYILGGTSAVSADVRRSVAALACEPEVRSLAGANRIETAMLVYEAGAGNWGDTAILACAGNYPDALAIGGFAYANGYPIFLVDGDELTAGQASALAGFERALVLGGTASVSQGVRTQAASLVSDVVELAGADRIETCRKIVDYERSCGMGLSRICIADAQNYPDALAGACLAGRCDSVTLLVNDTDASDANIAEVIGENADRVGGCSIFGGSSAVSTRTEQKIRASLGL